MDKNTKKPTVSIVLPLRNEGENIAGLLAEIVTAAAPIFDYDILCINDGSTDNTADVLKQCQTLYPALKVLSHQQSCGQSAAILTGVRHSTKDYIATLDGDGQNDPRDLAVLWDWLSQQQGAAMAIGHRQDRQDDESRKKASEYANAIRQFVLKDDCPDSGCGIKMLSRALFLELPAFDHMHRFMPALVKRAGGVVASLPVHHRPRTGGVSNYTNWKRGLVGVVDLLGVWWLMRRGKRGEVV